MPIIPTPELPEDGSTADVGDYNPIIIAILSLLNGQLDGDNLKSKSLPWSVMDDFQDAIPASAMEDSGNLELFRKDVFTNFVAEGCIVSRLTGRDGAMTAGVVYIEGKRVKVDAALSRTYTASKDTYVSVSNAGVVGYTEVNNNASAPALPSNSVWVAMVKTNASTITQVIRDNAIDSNGATIYRTGPVSSKSQGDTGWQPLTANSGYTSDAFYRRIGDVVYLRGQMNKNSGNVTNSDVMATLPVGMRPPALVTTQGLGSANTRAKVAVNDFNGTIVVVSTPSDSSTYMRIDNTSFIVG